MFMQYGIVFLLTAHKIVFIIIRKAIVRNAIKLKEEQHPGERCYENTRSI